MGKMNGTWHSISMVVIVIFIFAASGVINMTSPYEAADPSLPSTVTVCDKSISLLSGKNNIKNALGYIYEDDTYNHYGISRESKTRLVSTQIGNHIVYNLDPFGKYANDCRIYNGVTTRSTKEKLEAVFCTDCIKTDKYYAEIFIDDKEVDYNIIDYPEDFEDCDFSFDEWFETTAKNYPNAEYVTVLICYYYDNSKNDILFYIYPEITYY